MIIHDYKTATWLMFVPVCEGERQRRPIVRKPAVLCLFPLIHEADPVIHATVGPTGTQQTVDKGLLKPGSMNKKTGEVRRGVSQNKKRKSR